MPGRGVGLGEDQRVVGLGRVGDPVLLAVQEVGAVVLADGRRQHRRDVGAGGRLGQAEAAELLALCHRLEVARVLLVAPELEERQRVQADVHRDQRAERRLAPLDLLADQRLAHVVEARAAVLGRDRRAQQPQLGHALDDAHVEVVVDVVLLRHRQDASVDELTHGLLDRALLVVQVEVHGPPRAAPFGGHPNGTVRPGEARAASPRTSRGLRRGRAAADRRRRAGRPRPRSRPRGLVPRGERHRHRRARRGRPPPSPRPRRSPAGCRANSSPPIRNAASAVRSTLVSTPPTTSSASSPAACPFRSFSALNPFRSQSTSAMGWPYRTDRDTSCSSRSLNARRLSSRVSGSCSARNCISSYWAAVSSAVVAWLANTRSAWSLRSDGISRSRRVVGPDHAHDLAGAAPERDDEPVVAPRERPAPAARRLVGVVLGSDPLERPAGGRADSSPRPRTAGRAGARAGRTASAELTAGSSRSHPCAARVRKPPVSGSGRSMQTFSKPSAVWMPSQTDWRISSIAERLGEARRHLQQLLERGAVAGRLLRLLGALDGDRGVVGHRDEHVELLVGRDAAAHGLVDREDADQVAVRVPQRHEERVVADASRRAPILRPPAGTYEPGACVSQSNSPCGTW